MAGCARRASASAHGRIGPPEGPAFTARAELNDFLQANRTGFISTSDSPGLSYVYTFARHHKGFLTPTVRLRAREPSYHLAAVPFSSASRRSSLFVPFVMYSSSSGGGCACGTCTSRFWTGPSRWPPARYRLTRISWDGCSSSAALGNRQANGSSGTLSAQCELISALGRRAKFNQPGADTASNLPENDDTRLLKQIDLTSSNPAAPDELLGHLDPSAQPAL
ncbi:hypothetical protein FA95DRAFT_1021540 [Auriscalpium vulgare]|uniref:Uncharacterized protein n=1 Tax=Auriscalpium vulgare TaxID=40419 RepID=A0ACB8R6Q8_9AGAM|nr:hypothetical protein FA95DRAFT_1021540 [Auriscalpium vulgare]